MELGGKKALVFGGTSGIGLSASELLRDSGVEVVAISREPSKAGDIEGIRLEQCDVRDPEALENLFAKEAPFDILISAATGGSRASGPFLKMELSAYQASFDKLWGYTNVVRLGTEHLTEQGSIVLGEWGSGSEGETRTSGISIGWRSRGAILQGNCPRNCTSKNQRGVTRGDRHANVWT